MDPEVADDYALFRERLQAAEERATLWQAHVLDLIRNRPGAREAVRRGLVAAGVLEEPRHETCRERRARFARLRREYREQRESEIHRELIGGEG